MIVCTYELAKMDEGGFDKSKLAEDAILKLIASKKRCSYEVDLTEGKNTDWDGKLGDEYVEVKFSAKTFKGDNRLGNFFETHYKSGKPSALLLTKATKYITITPGWSNKYQMLTGKVRMWKVSDLIAASNVFEKVIFDYDEYGFFIPNKCDSFKHEWIGDIFFDQKNMSYDTSKWI